MSIIVTLQGEAKENILGEIQDNHKTLHDNLPKLASNEQQLKTLLENLGEGPDRSTSPSP